MLQRIGEYGKCVEIAGFRGVKFSEAEAFLKKYREETHVNLELQFFDARLVATSRHLYFAALNALQAFANKTNISKSLAVETMLYASAQRQIQKAIRRCGIKPQTTIMAALIIGENPVEIKSVHEAIKVCVGMVPDETVLEMSRAKAEEIMEAFQIKAEEVNAVIKDGNLDAAVVSLVVERVALLATQL
jgi:tRNA threonylcarbamoyladenosine modification (KEOPS) complex Cgi121 subunit